MNVSKLLLKYAAPALAGAAMLAASTPSFAGVIISVGIAPPVLPVYAQPICPGDGYMWTPGYWAYGAAGGYYFVPGVWVQPPSVGVLWTPGYWGFAGGQYRWNGGYWGPHIGFYGGVNYGFGFFGHGFEGGYWGGGHFFYNTAYGNFGGGFHPTNVYVHNVTIVNNTHVSFNGGTGGVQARPEGGEIAAMHEQHVGATPNQVAFRNQAASNPSQRFSANGGHPGTMAAATTRDGFGHANEVNARQGNQQARINQGVKSGQMTPGETRNVENRDTSIHNQAQADRAANGGNLTNTQKAQINQRQNNVSRSIDNDKHNANNDQAAAARHNEAPKQEQHQAQHAEANHEPHPKR